MKTIEEERNIILQSKETFRHIAEMLRTQNLTPRTKKRVEDFVAMLMVSLSTDMDVEYIEFAERRIVKIADGKLSYQKEHPYKLIRVSLERR